MKSVSIRELHEKTGEWVRLAEVHEQIVITDHGRPIASLSPFRQPAKRNRFRAREILPAYAKLRRNLSRGTDSSVLISEDRDGAAAR